MLPGDLGDALGFDLSHVWHPMTQHSAFLDRPPLLITGGEGARVIDARGRRYLDAMAGLWCVNIGYGRREVAEAVYRQMISLAYYPHLQANAPAAALAKRLSDLTGGEFGRTYFVNSGTEAVEAAMKIALQYHRLTRPGEARYKFIGRHLSYHGMSMAALGLGGIPERKVMFEPLAGAFVKAPIASPYRCWFCRGECTLACADYVEFLIRTEDPRTVAAVVVEPVQSAAGVLVPPPGYLQRLSDVCKKYGVLLIVDEVITGFGRTGKWFAYQHEGVAPDIMCVAKGLSSGYQPIGATLVREEIFQAFLSGPGKPGSPQTGRELMQVNTWGGHAAACAGALANLDIMEREGLVDRSARMGAYLLDRLRAALDHPVVGNVRGRGLMIAVELVRDKSTKEPLDGERMARVLSGCLERGVIVGRSAGTGAGLGNCVVLSPPLVLSESDADEIVDALAASIGSL